MVPIKYTHREDEPSHLPTILYFSIFLPLLLPFVDDKTYWAYLPIPQETGKLEIQTIYVSPER